MEPQTLDNPIRGRFNAWFFDALEGYMHRKYGAIKVQLLKEAPSVVVEIGPGAGANLRYLRPGSKLIAVEPNRHFHPVLRRRARERGVELDLRELSGESLDLETASADFVFSTLVLCSVARPDDVLAEIRRVLRPGGRFACVEHVPAPAGSALAGLQRAIAKPWKWMFEGCDLCRDTPAILRAAGFPSTEVVPMTIPTIFFPIRPQITATCVN